MLEQMSFSCGGYSRDYELITIQNHNGCLNVDYYLIPKKNPQLSFPHYHASWTRERSKRWLSKIESIHFGKWEDSYYREDICDGTQWTLSYHYEGEIKRKIFGNNDYPDNWELFQNIMRTISHKLPRVEDTGIKDILELSVFDEDKSA